MVQLIHVEQSAATLNVVAGQVANAAEQIRAIASAMELMGLDMMPIPNQKIFASAIDAIDTYVKGARKALRENVPKGAKKKPSKSTEK